MTDKYTFRRDFSDKFSGIESSVTVECNGGTLDELLEHVTDFLRGCGFTIESGIQVVEIDVRDQMTPDEREVFDSITNAPLPEVRL